MLTRRLCAHSYRKTLHRVCTIIAEIAGAEKGTGTVPAFIKQGG